jgi:hypothetical protein
MGIEARKVASGMMDNEKAAGSTIAALGEGRGAGGCRGPQAPNITVPMPAKRRAKLDFMVATARSVVGLNKLGIKHMGLPLLTSFWRIYPIAIKRERRAKARYGQPEPFP